LDIYIQFNLRAQAPGASEKVRPVMTNHISHDKNAKKNDSGLRSNCRHDTSEALFSNKILHSQVCFAVINLQIFPSNLRFLHDHLSNLVAPVSKSCAERLRTGILAIGIGEYIQFHRVSLSSSVPASVDPYISIKSGLNIERP
jgi:hypothetical protein